ncbi:MAG: glycosyltransferase family 2 protein [Pyrinomonadaceae bacterium]|nr:glycosyltransferase family 2 protein [Pyrinomonadaceae bacterium]
MGKASERPFVSIIIPVRNEAAFIDRCLASVLDQTYPKNRVEIIVADGMSADRTREKIRSIAATSEVPIAIVDNPKKIAPTGLNRAIERATGDVIIRVDGHCEIDKDYVANCVALLESGRADGVGGPIETIGETAKAAAISKAMSSRFGVGGSAFRTVKDREMLTDTVAFPAYTRNIIERVGPFNEELVRNQDDEYNRRIWKLGGKILLSPAVRSRYYSRGTFRSLWRQYFQYGYWKIRVLQLHPTQMSLRQFVPFAFVVSILLLAVSAPFFNLLFFIFVGIVGAYAFANILASIITAGLRAKEIAYVATSFCILHFAYGSGSLVGLIAFRNRWRRRDTPIPVERQLS